MRRERRAASPKGANAAGAYLAGAVPHREPGGAPAVTQGLSARAMLESALKAYVLFGGIDPASDFGVEPSGLATAELVIAVTTHLPESLRASVHVVLPIGILRRNLGHVRQCGRALAELGGRREAAGREPAGLEGAARARESAECARRRLRQLGGDSRCVEGAVRNAHRGSGNGVDAGGARAVGVPDGQAPAGSWVDIPPYQCDVLVRGSEALSKTKDGRMTRTVI